MSVDSFIPEIWAQALLENLHNVLVYAQDGIVNTDYQGDIAQQGDTVHIDHISAVTISDYTKNSDHSSPEALTTTDLTLVIDQAKMFNFQVDDVDRAQVANGGNLMSEGMREAAYGLGNIADQFIAGLYTGVAGGNTLGSTGTPLIPTKDTAYEELVNLSVVLDNANCPDDGNRWVVVPNWFHGLLRKDDRFVHATAAGDQVLRNGEVGQAAGFRVLKSNNVPNANGEKYKIIAGHPSAISFAEQINEVRAYRPEKRFGDAVKGLHLYGGKLVRPTCIAVLYADPTAQFS